MNLKLILDFLSELKKNNSKEWMDANRSHYETAKKEFQKIINFLIAEIHLFDTTLVGAETKNTIFRINRDIRFSNDKRPYKENFGAYICKEGKKSGFAGYYIHLEPDNCFLGGGVYLPEASILSKIRQEIDYCGEEYVNIIETPGFKNTFGEVKGDTLSRPPKGYDKENPYIEHLKMKSFLASIKIDSSKVMEDGFLNDVVKKFSVMKPFIQFLNRPLEDEV